MPIYVVQTTSGNEKQLCNQIAKRIDNTVVNECFVPCSEIAKRYGGTWHRTERPLFPGYVFVDAADLEGFKHGLRSIEGLTKVLGYEEGPQPLNTDEIAWLHAVLGTDDHTAHMSEGVIEGDTITILSGPLMGRTSTIRKIDRHKRMALVEVQMFGRTMLVKMGLEIKQKSA